MTGILTIILLVAVLESSSADMSVLEKFLTSGFSKESKTDTDQDNENTYVANTEDLVKFMKRAGLINPVNQNNYQQQVPNTFQSLTPQQTAYYLPQLSQQSQLTNYVAPDRQLTQQSSQQQPNQQQSQLNNYVSPNRQLTEQQQSQLLKLQKQLLQQQKLRQQLLQQQSTTESSKNDENTEGESNVALETQRDTDSKAVSKADRQGYYINDDQAGYSGHAGYANPHDGFSDHQDTYSGVHYGGGHAPVAYKPEVYSPPKQASVAVKIDPISILRLLLQGIPRPLLNLNGKVFFGVELGKSVGGYKTAGYAGPPSGGKGVVLNLG